MRDQEDDQSPTAPEEGPSSAPFDPYRFQTMEVSTELRRELTHATLPRLDAKFFDDTNPEARAVARARPRRGWQRIGTLVVGALVASAVAFALHHSRGGRNTPPASSVR